MPLQRHALTWARTRAEAISALFRMDTDGKMYVAPEVNAAVANEDAAVGLVLDDDDDDDAVNIIDED